MSDRSLTGYTRSYRPGRDKQLRCPACSGELERLATKAGVPKFCPWCSAPLPHPRERGFDRMMRGSDIHIPGDPGDLITK